MLFNTLDFIIFFIVVLATIVIIKNRKFQHLFLLFASYFFFYYSSNYLISLLLFTTIWDYYFGRAIWKAKNIKIKKRSSGSGPYADLACSASAIINRVGLKHSKRSESIQNLHQRILSFHSSSICVF